MRKKTIALLLFSLLCTSTVYGRTKTLVVEVKKHTYDKYYSFIFKGVEQIPPYQGNGDKEGFYNVARLDYTLPTYYIRERVTRVVFESSVAETRPTTTANWFLSMSSLTSDSITGLNYLNTSRVTSMTYMFYGCSKLTTLDLSHFDTSRVQYMSLMFYGCSELTDLDVSSFNTKNVILMYSMFEDCSNLTNLDLSNFDTSNVTGMSGMFHGCSKLTNLNVSSFNTSNVKNMEWMFADCRGLTSLDLSNFDMRKVTQKNYIVLGCRGLKVLNLGANDLRKTTTGKLEYGNGRASYVGSETNPCRLIRTFDRVSLGNAIIKKDVQMPPYYKYCDGYFTIADTLDSEKDYIEPLVKDDADLWVKARTLKGNVWNH